MQTGNSDSSANTEQVINTTCNSHCGGTCLLKVHVQDGVIRRIETDDGAEPQYRACLKGRAYRQRVYDPDRLKYPMKRVGERGEGKFKRISWDEALDTVASELNRVKETYGSEAILYPGNAGDLGVIHSTTTIDRLLCRMGGYSAFWGIDSFEGSIFAELATFGTMLVGNSRDDFLNSRLIILWGVNPADTIHDSNTNWYLIQAKERGIRMISVDPRYTATTANLADQWIPIIPGTDAAMLIAMAYVMIRENLQDQAFLDAHTVGFDRFKDYLLGKEDGVAKTLEWAEAITGVPAATIEGLAREYATTKPAALLAGIAAGRTAYGEQYHRAAMTLAAMTGNIGVPGGWSGSRTLWNAIPVFEPAAHGLFAYSNPVEKSASPSKNKLPTRRHFIGGSGRMNSRRMSEAILQGKAGGYPADFKLLFLFSRNTLTNGPNVNKMAEAFKKLEFIVVGEQVMTPTAKFADILLPINTFMERNDFNAAAATPPFYGCVNKVIDSLYESKSKLEIATALAERLGFSDLVAETEEEQMRAITQACKLDYDSFKAEGVHRFNLPEPYVAFKSEVEDPEHHPFPTPSGKIEIYSQQIADMNIANLPPIPKYIQTWESRADPLTGKYPLQLISSHFRRRAHSQFENVPWLRELQTHAALINTADAKVRGINDGDMVRVFNDRGQIVLPAQVTQRIIAGVVDVPHGAWYAPDEKGVDRGGCPNVLTRDEPSPGGAFVTNTALVQVEKTEES